MNDNEQRQAHNQLRARIKKCFHVYYITIYILRITIYFLLSTRMNSFLGEELKTLPTHQSGSDSPRFRIGSHIVIVRGVGYKRSLLHRLLYHITHAEKADTVFQERSDYHFVGRIDDARHIPPRYIAS